MNKYTWMMLLAFFIMLITLAADSILVTPNGGIDTVPGGIELTFSGILSLFSTYGKILTFNLPGFPAFLTALVFIPINLAFGLLMFDSLAKLFGKG
jgi:hypothetical protein